MLLLAVVALIADPHPLRIQDPSGAVGLGLTLIGALVVMRVLRTFVRISVAAHRRRRRHACLIDVFSSPMPGRKGVSVVDTTDLFAYAIPGRRLNRIVLSRGLLDRLGDQEVEAVLSHEHRHLRGRHHIIRQLSDAIESAFPCSGTRAVRARTDDLLEMCADCAARGKVGNRVTARAILTLTGMSAPPDALGANSPSPTAARLHHLLDDTRCCRSPRAITTFGAAGLVGLAPVTAAYALLVVEFCRYVCP